MQFFDAARIQSLVGYEALIEALRDAFVSGYPVAERQMHRISSSNDEFLLLYMPAFAEDGNGAVKLATYCPTNAGFGLPRIHALVIMFSENGTPQAVLDGAIITNLRTAAASALASTYLSRRDSSHLAILGTGALAPFLALAHCEVRAITQITIWGRRIDQAERVAREVRRGNPDAAVNVALSARECVSHADIISCCTSSSEPILFGEWLQPGTHVDLVGSFVPSKREADDAVVKGSSIYVDTLEGALSEAGDIIDPLKRGIIERDSIKGDLADLIRGHSAGRISGVERTVFKSVGTPIEDFAAGQLVLRVAERDNPVGGG